MTVDDGSKYPMQGGRAGGDRVEPPDVGAARELRDRIRVTGNDLPSGEWQQAVLDVIAQALATHARAAAERERERCARLVTDWADQYPEDIFLPPKPGEHGRTVDGCSAHALRTTLPRVAAAIRALPGEGE